MDHPQLEWNLDAAALIAIAVWSAVYLRRFAQARREAGGRGAGMRHLAAFAGAVTLVVIAVISPLDRLGEEYLFSAHMVQHLLLGDIAPLLLLLALSRVIMRPATRRLQRVERALGPFAHPVTALFVWLALVYLWHVPALYVAAIEQPGIHALEHASFFIAGVGVWWPLIQPVPMRHRLSGMWTFGYIAAAKFGLASLGLYLTWSNAVAYDWYAEVPRIWGLSAIEDQNIGGAIMMVEQSLVLVTVLAVLFARMLAQSEQEEQRRERLAESR